ncbi:MAG: competence protein CoiA family protein, partial [Cyanobacteria bacterium J06555_3]
MWLQYALDKDDNLVSVHDVKRGRSNIRCPYCKGELTAKKGKVKAHHFAHVTETCNWAAKNSNFNLPLFWGFDLVLDRSYLNTLKELEQRDFRTLHYSLRSLQKQENRIFGYLKRKKVISDRFSYQVGLTDLGKVILKKITLLEFCEIQEKLSQEKFIKLRQKVLDSEDFHK